MAPLDGRSIDTAIREVCIFFLTRTRVIWRRRAGHTALIRFCLGLSVAPGFTVVVVARILFVLFVHHLHLFLAIIDNPHQSTSAHAC